MRETNPFKGEFGRGARLGEETKKIPLGSALLRYRKEGKGLVKPGRPGLLEGGE